MAEQETATPPIPQDVDLRDFAFTPMFRSRLFGSSFHARVSDAGWRAGVTLWLKSWDQVPAGSLPDDDIDLCRLAEFGRDMKTWAKVKTEALWGWEKYADGRLYHKVVSEGVIEAWEGKLRQRWRTECARIRKHNQRHKTSIQETDFVTWKNDGCPIGQHLPVPIDTDEKSQEQSCETDSKGQGERKGQGQGQRDSNIKPNGLEVPAKKSRSKARTAIAENTQPDDRQKADATEAGLSEIVFREQWRAFRDHHLANGSLMADWPAAWRKWLGNMAKFQGYRGAPSVPPKGEAFDMGGDAREVKKKDLAFWIAEFSAGKPWRFESPAPGLPGCRVPDDLLPPKYHQSKVDAA